MTCRCGTENAADARFCLACGTPLRGDAPPAPAPPEAVAPPVTGIRRYSTPIALAVLGIAAAGYYFFLRADPERDGKRAADAYCACSVAYNADLVAGNEAFAKAFPKSFFARRSEARAKWTESLTSTHEASGACSKAAEARKADLQKRYIANQVTANAFQFAFNAQMGTCESGNDRLGESNNAVIALINGINDPEPDIEQIKNNLVGYQFPMLRVGATSQLTNGTIRKTTTDANRTTLRVTFLIKAYGNQEHEAELDAVYFQGSQGWGYGGAQIVSFTYDNVIPDGWVSITPYSNYTFTVPDDKRLAWKTFGYGPEIQTGPDVPDVPLPAAYSYQVRSREGAPVTVRFTYRPR